MTALARLVDEGRRLVSEDLLTGVLAVPQEEHVKALIEPTSRTVDLARFDQAIDQVIAESTRFDPEIDARAAPLIHLSLPMGRRQAADPAVWRFLAVVHRPDFVRHRWEYRSRSTMVTRFWNFGTRPDSNALCRLWWMAELTSEHGDYTLTKRALSSQSIANSIFVRNFSSYRPAVQAFVDVFGHAQSARVEKAVRIFSSQLSTVVLEARSADDLRVMLEDIGAGLDSGSRPALPAAGAPLPIGLRARGRLCRELQRIDESTRDPKCPSCLADADLEVTEEGIVTTCTNAQCKVSTRLDNAVLQRLADTLKIGCYLCGRPLRAKRAKWGNILRCSNRDCGSNNTWLAVESRL